MNDCLFVHYGLFYATENPNGINSKFRNSYLQWLRILFLQWNEKIIKWAVNFLTISAIKGISTNQNITLSYMLANSND